MGYFYSEEYLEHHGILGQKWGIRRFESAGGHLTAAGKARYNSVDGKYQKIKAAKATANESYKKFNSDWNKAALASVSLSKKKRAEAAALREKAKASGKKADEDIANIKKAKTDYKFEKKMAKVDAERDKILDMRAKNREKLENKKMSDEKKAAKLKDFDKDTEYVKAGYEKYNKVLSNYRDAKIGSLDKEMAKSAKKDYVNQVLSDMTYGSKSMTVLGYASDAAKAGNKTDKAAKQERKQQLKDVNPDLAKNKATKQVAVDYNNMDNKQFRSKYYVSKGTYQKRYVKSDGDTYSMGKKKQAAVKALLGRG